MRIMIHLDGIDHTVDAQYDKIEDRASLAMRHVADRNPTEHVALKLCVNCQPVTVLVPSGFLRERWLEWARTWVTVIEPLDLRPRE